MRSFHFILFWKYKMCCVREAEKSCGAAGTGISKNTHTNESDAATERAQRKKRRKYKSTSGIRE